MSNMLKNLQQHVMHYWLVEEIGPTQLHILSMPLRLYEHMLTIFKAVIVIFILFI